VNKRVNRYSADVQSPLAALSYMLLSGLLGAWLLWDAVTIKLAAELPYTQYWNFVAVITEWLNNPASLTNPQVDDPSLSARFMPLYWLLATVGRALNLSAIELMAVSSVVNYVLIVVGLKLFLQAYFRNGWAPTLGFVVLFAFAGSSLFEPNVFQLRSFVYVAGYPASFTFGMSLILFWLTLMLLRGDLPLAVTLPALAAVAALVFLGDPVTGWFGVVGCLLLILTEPLGSSRTVGMAVGALLVGLAGAELWPYFSVWKLTLGLYPGADTAAAEAIDPATRFASGAWAHPLYTPRMVVGTLGLSLLGLPVMAWLALQRQHWFIVGGAVAMAVPYALNLFIPIAGGPAFLWLVAVFLQFAIVYAWLSLVEAWDEIPRPFMARPALLASVVAGAAILTGNVWMTSLEYSGQTLPPGSLRVESRQADNSTELLARYRDLLAPVDESAVVLATPRAGWAVPVVKGKVVAMLHSNPLIADQAERLEAAADFFFRPVSEMRRVEIAQSYAADYVLVDTADTAHSEKLADWLNLYGRPVSSSGRLRLFSVAPEVHAMVLPEPPPPAALAAQREVGKPGDAPSPPRKPARKPTRSPAAEQAEPDPDAEADDELARSYGAPIAAPILDPERHGA